MKSVLIVGAGRFGRHMAQKLNQLGHQVMIVDGDEERVRVALPYATRGLIGDTPSVFINSGLVVSPINPRVA